MRHSNEVCEYGFTHRQCRCFAWHATKTVKCDTPDYHAGKVYPIDVPEPDVVESTHERVQNALYDFVSVRFWYLYPGAQRDIVNDIEAALIKAGILP